MITILIHNYFALSLIFIILKGFRNCVNFIKAEFEFDVKIPFCRQLNKESPDELLKKQTKLEQPLSSAQAAESRLVSKVRYQIENVNGKIKQDKALDYVSNNKLHYLFSEYRISCAMINFTFKPVWSDKPVTEKVARMMRQRYELPQFNDLEFLLGKQLGTTSFRQVDLESIDDFVMLKRRQMTRFIFNGTFHLKRARSYLIDLVTQSIAYVMEKNQLKKIVENLPNNECYKQLKTYINDERAKVIATKVFSRHKRAFDKKLTSNEPKKSYKVFICYYQQNRQVDDSENTDFFELPQPQVNRKPQRYKDIKSFICSCKNGKRIISPCIHVSSLIYYLSWAKIRLMKFPAEHLNSIFLKSPNEPANCPK